MDLADPIVQGLRSALGEQLVEWEGWLGNGLAPRRDQGWKLHVSATPRSAPAVLDRVLPILTAERVPFKVVANLGCLGDLNEGLGGLSQVGKLLTVYPDDDPQAVRLALALDRATDGLDGPRVPSDRPLRPGSLVHYRYGGFTDLEVTDSLGQTIPAIRDPAGNLEPDPRNPRFEPPAWATDPFQAAGVLQLPPPPASTLFGGFLILSVLHQHAKGGVYLALDPNTAPPRTCVLKEGRKHLLADVLGRDIRDRLRYQYRLLQELAPDPALPEVYQLFELEENLYLVMEHLEGQTLEALTGARQREGEQVPAAQVAALGAAVATAVGRLHGRGWILRDLTPTNIIVTAEQRVCLIDLELAYAAGDPTPPYGWGTRGYTSPQQAGGEWPTPADDIYALGASLYFLATGSDPSFLPEDVGLRRRALSLLNPDLPAVLVETIAACMDPDPARRPPTMAAVTAALSVAAAPAATASLVPIAPTVRAAAVPAPPAAAGRAERWLVLARGAGDMLLAAAEPVPEGTRWSSTATTHQAEVGAAFLPRRRAYARYLHTGTAGTALFLADLGVLTGDDRYLTTAEEAARWLIRTAPAGREALPGLYFGEAGVAALLCRLARATGKATYLDAAAACAATLTPDRTAIPDLTHGWAGMGLLHLMLAAAGGDRRHLTAARALGDALALQAEPVGPGLGWRHPPGPYTGLSGDVLTGFAHGAAGIAYFLLELWRATDDGRYYELAAGAARWLGDAAEPCLADGSGRNWPLAEGRPDRWFYWCHGAAGIGLFYLRAWALTGEPAYRELAEAAGRTTAVGGRRGGGTLCHGLAGNGDLLVEAYRVLREPAWLEAATAFADLLALYARPQEPGTAWPAEHPDVVTPDYMVGYAGVGAFFLRLAAPDRAAHPLLLA